MVMSDRTATTTQAHEFPSWPDFVAWFTDVQETHLPKNSLSAWSPQLRSDNGRKQDEHLTAVTVAVLDIDSASTEQIATLQSALQGLAWAWHSSYSHSPTQTKLRVAIQLANPVPAAQWGDVWAALQVATGNISDTQCRDASRIYYCPFRPAGAPETAGSCPGVPLDWTLLPTPQTGAQAPERTAPTHALLTTVGKRWGRKPSTADAARILKAALNGECFAPRGERDQALFALATALARDTYTQNVDPYATAMLMSSSLAAVCKRDGDSEMNVDLLARKIERAQANVQEQLDEVQSDARAESLAQMQSRGREGFYTQDEIALWSAWQDIEPAQFSKRLIVLHGQDHYVWWNGVYQGPLQSGLATHLRQALLPATDEPLCVQLHTVDSKGQIRPKTADEIKDGHTLSVTSVVTDMTVQHSYIQDGFTFVRSACPVRSIQPSEDTEVAAWLKHSIQDPEQYQAVLDWLATVTRLDRPSAALYLAGPPGTGKSLLAQGVARLWGTQGATDLVDVVGAWSDRLVQNGPLVFADEYLPTEFVGAHGTKRLRDMVTRRQRTLNKKYAQQSSIEGYVRLVIAANSLNLFDSIEEHLTSSDVAALCERLLYVDMDGPRLPPNLGHSFLTEDRIAAYALHLSATREVKPRGRLWVEGTDSPLHRQIRIVSHVKSMVCHFLVTALSEPRRLTTWDPRGDRWQFDKGEFWIDPSLVYEKLGEVARRERQPSAGELGKALAELSDGRRGPMRRVNVEDLLQWVHTVGLGDEATVRQTLSQPPSVHKDLN